MRTLPTPGTIIGYRKNGAPIRVIAGGSMPAEPGTTSNVTYPGTTTSTTTAQPPIIIQNPPAPGQYFTAEQLEAARQQEKDKLYGRMQTLEQSLAKFQTEIETLSKAREDAEAEAQRKAAEAAEAARLAAEEKLSVKELIEKRDAEWRQQQEELTKQLEKERALMKKEHEFVSLQAYIQRRVAEEVAADAIAPEFLDFVGGNSEEEVEASITRVKEKTASIISGMGGKQSPPRQTPGVSPTGLTPTGPLDNLTGTQQLTEADIAKMSMTEYAALRARVGIDKAGSNKGLFS